jgi:hypothetical protein
VPGLSYQTYTNAAHQKRRSHMSIPAPLTEADSARDSEHAKAAILAYRNGLLAEHLGAQIDQVSSLIEAERSLIRTIDRLNGPGGRRLGPVDVGADDGEAIASAMDPEAVDAAFSRKRT